MLTIIWDAFRQTRI